MNATIDEPIVTISRSDEDGDEWVSRWELSLWNYCAICRRLFDTDDVIFKYRDFEDRPEPAVLIDFFVPRDHRRVAEIEAWIMKSVARRSQELAAWKLKEDPGHMGVCVTVYRYSGMP